MTAAFKLLSLHHLQHAVLGYAADALLRPGLAVTHLDLRHGDVLPGDPSAFQAIISWGGEHSVRDLHEHEYIRKEQTFLARAVDLGVPVLGVCLGAQILATSLGSSVRRMATGTHLDLPETRLTAAARSDPIFSRLAESFPAVHWHEDCFDAPDGGVELVERACQGCGAFRYGSSAWGVQFHPEASPDVVFQWWRRTIEQAPVDEAAAARVMRKAADGNRALSESAGYIFGGFIEFARGR